LTISFLAVDSKGEHQTGEPVTWSNTIQVKYRFYHEGGQLRCELQAVPQGEVRYSTDGSNPTQHGQVYTQPFVVPPSARFVLAQATAHGIVSETLTADVPQAKADGTGGGPIVDPSRAATWRHNTP
jgi:hypothetical protein